MAITKINTPELLDINTTGAKRLPSGTTAQRPTTGLTAGDFRYNTDDDRVEYYDGTSPYDAAKWFQIDDEALPATCTTDTINYPTGTTNTAYYKMSDATDSTLNGYNGTASNVNFNVQGKFGNAGSFNGSSSKIVLPNSSFQTAAFTISAWCNVTANGSENSIFEFTDTNSGNDQSVILLSAGSTSKSSRFLFRNRTTNEYSYGPSGTPLSGWNHYCMTFDGSTVKSYINKSEVDSSSFSITNTIASTNEVLFGLSAGDRFLNGKIDQVRIFSTALTAANVTSLYNEVQCVPAIIPSDYFNTVLYTGTGVTNPITTVGFPPDFTWVKSINNSRSHALVDSVRGGNGSAMQILDSATTAAQFLGTNYFNSLDNAGFTVSGNDTYTNNGNFVAWNWKAAATTTTIAANTVGNTIASDVRASTESGFSIVSYTGNSTTGATVGHGLSEVPEIIIVKRLQTPVDNWAVYNVTIGNSYRLALDDPAAKSGPNRLEWNNTTPTSTVFTLGNHSAVNQSSSYIAYCFASIPGMSDIGSYIGTNAPNNTIVTGFRPAYLMIKLTSAANGNWIIFDNKRNTSNPLTDVLKADDAAVETTEAALNIDFLSNGFTLNGAAGAGGTGQINSIGETYIYLAIAEQVYNANGVTANQTNPFNDGSQIVQYEFEDNADDSQPNGYIGKGGTFNGSSSYITGFPTITNDITISLWFKSPSIPSSTEYLFGETDDEPITFDDYIGCGINTSGQIIASYRPYNSNAPVSITSVGVFADNNWHLVSLTLSTSQLVIYVDGNVVGSSTITGTINLPDVPLGAFNSRGTINQHFNGSIDQVRIYNTALNPNDVWLLYSETSATSSTLDYPASTGAIALYELEGDATSTSSSTYNGAATAVAWVPLYDGTPTSMTYAAPSVSAPFLKAASFSGSNYITTPTLPDYRSGFGFSSWVLSDTTNNKFILTQRTTGGYANFAYRLTSGKVSLLTGNGTSAYYIFYTAPTALTDGWHHIVVTGTSTTIKIYVDGSLLTTQTGTAFTNSSNMGHVMGVNYYNGNYDYVGAGSYSLDQFRIFNKALDSGEVLQLYNEPNN